MSLSLLFEILSINLVECSFKIINKKKTFKEFFNKEKEYFRIKSTKYFL